MESIEKTNQAKQERSNISESRTNRFQDQPSNKKAANYTLKQKRQDTKE